MYYDKYLKYKIKYNNLKNQSGGVNTIELHTSPILQLVQNQGFIQEEVIISKDTKLEEYISNESRIYVINDYDYYIITNINNSNVLLTNLKFGNDFNSPIFGDETNDIIPLSDDKLNTIKILMFGDDFDQPINKEFKILQELKFGWSFNNNLSGLIAQNLQTLKFGWNFNKDINIELPELVSLEFGHEFNSNINKLKAPKLQKLKFGENFSCSLDLELNSLQELEFGNTFEGSIDKLIAPSLHTLIFGNNFNNNMNLTLNSLKTLKFKGNGVRENYKEILKTLSAPYLTHYYINDMMYNL